MPDREMVVAALECLADGRFCACCRYKPYDDCEKRVARDAIILLKEQDAVEPKVIGENEFGHPVHACGKCGHLITESMNYCSWCGCKVGEWNDWHKRIAP